MLFRSNPRYLLAPKTKALRYHAVPAVFSTKAHAEAFAEQWGRQLGPCELVYTRTAEGRHALLKARAQGLALSEQAGPQLVSCWR